MANAIAITARTAIQHPWLQEITINKPGANNYRGLLRYFCELYRKWLMDGAKAMHHEKDVVFLMPQSVLVVQISVRYGRAGG